MPQLGDIQRGYKKGHSQWCACEVCKKERWVRIEKGIPRSKLCKNCGQRVSGYLSRNGKRLNQKGYIAIGVLPTDFFYPMACRGYILEHRLVMARHLNRCLLPWEVVHHKNGVRNDNRFENLELLPERRWHLIDTKTKSYIRQLEKRNRTLINKIKLLEEGNGKN
jgi:hypothetical protein